MQDAQHTAQHWLAAFEQALNSHRPNVAAGLFLAEGQWRDLLAFTWTIKSIVGHAAIQSMLQHALTSVRPANFRIDPRRTAPRLVHRAAKECIEAFIMFDTAIGSANGVLRLLPDADAPGQAWTLSTCLQELRGFEEGIGTRRPSGPSGLRDFGAKNWLDYRNNAAAYEDRDPAVLVVGAGHAGLSIAARLGVLGIDTLVVDRHARVGDNWRHRYHSLTLHNEVFVNDLPYLPFPQSWPKYISKDKLASWLEFYFDAMEINCWTRTELVSGTWDDQAKCWAVTLKGADGATRSMKPRHVIFAVGASPISYIPKLPGLQTFAGTLMHSGEYATGVDWRGRKALVLGSGTSGHDVAQDLTACGAQVTMIQRGPTYIVSLKEAQRVYTTYTLGLPVEECDQLGISYPYPALLGAYKTATAEATRNDRKLLDDLVAAGFQIDLKDGDTGFQPRYFERGGGYYFNVGCSDLIIEGKVKVVQFSDLQTFTPEGARLRGGRSVHADLLVLATGYLGQQDVVRQLLGDEIADRVGPVWGLGDDGELRNMWTRTPREGLWFHAGSLPQCRIYSRLLALQIKACEAGLIPLSVAERQSGNKDRTCGAAQH